MREKKSFFTENNRLNKGYKAVSNSAPHTTLSLGDTELDLPEASILAAYEEIQPGTISKMMEMAAKEQEHRQNMELLQINMQKIGIRMGRLFAIFSMMAICYTSFAMAIGGMRQESIVFTVLGFSAIAISACSGRCKNNVCTAKESSRAPFETKKQHTAYSSSKAENKATLGQSNNYKPYYHKKRKREVK